MRALDEAASKAMLAEAGFPIPQSKTVDTPQQAARAAVEIGFPVVCKLSCEGLLHKSDVGGVALQLENAQAVKNAAEALRAQADQHCKAVQGAPTRLLVEKQIEAGVDLIAGLKHDAVFGYVLMVGLGGVFAEVLEDTAVRLCPVEPKNVQAMLEELRGWPLLAGARGTRPVDRSALRSFLAAFSRWPQRSAGERELFEVDINPLRATARAVCVLDATVVLRETVCAKVPCSPKAPKEMRVPVEIPEPELPTVDRFFEAQSVAVIGASPQRHKGGNVILRNLRRLGFGGRVVAVHPHHEEILGLETHATVQAIPGSVDLAVAVVPRDKLDGVVRDVAASQTRHLIVATAGFADLGPAGMDLQKRLLGRARAAGVRVMGPNSIGVINTSTGLATSFTTLHPLRRGTVGLFGQTGTFASGYANWFASNGHTGVSKIACIGNKGHTDEADLLEYFARDPSVNVIGMYTEGVSNPAFLRRLREMAGRKPLCVLRAGKTAAGRRIVATHTGSLVGEDRVFRAAFRETGVVEVEDIDELFLTLSAFENLPPPRAARVAVVSITGIGCVLSAEGAAAAGVDLVQLEKETLTQINRLAPAWAPVHNPFDIWAMIEKQGAEKAYRATALPAFEDPNVDALMLIFVLIEESRFDVGALIAELRARQPQKPILFTVLGGSVEAAREWIDAARQGGALYVSTPAAGMRLLARMERFSRFRRDLISE